MNVTTGEVIRLLPEQLVPEGFVPVSERVARAVEIGMKHLNRADRRKQLRMARRGKSR